jgi:hypothetical protein
VTVIVNGNNSATTLQTADYPEAFDRTDKATMWCMAKISPWELLSPLAANDEMILDNGLVKR